jgi:orotidine-5'-phosphate decarboxylase
LKEIWEYGLDKDFKLIVNSSRSIIYASPNDDFAKKASEAAKKIQNEMELIIDKLWVWFTTQSFFVKIRMLTG